MALTVTGDVGEIVVPMFAVPRGARGRRASRDRTSYTYQLEAFASAVRNGRAVGNAELVDAAYAAAGLRGPATSMG